MASDDDILKDVPDAKPLRIFLPVKASRERYRMQCVYQKIQSPRFNLLFQPGTLPVDSINTSEPCILNIDLGGPNLSIEAMITAIPNSQIIEMIVKKSISYEPDEGVLQGRCNRACHQQILSTRLSREE